MEENKVPHPWKELRIKGANSNMRMKDNRNSIWGTLALWPETVLSVVVFSGIIHMNSHNHSWSKSWLFSFFRSGNWEAIMSRNMFKVIAAVTVGLGFDLSMTMLITISWNRTTSSSGFLYMYIHTIKYFEVKFGLVPISKPLQIPALWLRDFNVVNFCL